MIGKLIAFFRKVFQTNPVPMTRWQDFIHILLLLFRFDFSKNSMMILAKLQFDKKVNKREKNISSSLKSSSAPLGVLAAMCGMLAGQDTHGNSRGAWGTLGGGVLCMKKFYGLEWNSHFRFHFAFDFFNLLLEILFLKLTFHLQIYKK